MDSAVQAIFDAKWGGKGIYKEEGGPVVAQGPAVPRQAGATRRPTGASTRQRRSAAYIWETYGRFPATIDPMMMNIWFQAHHLETEFYDQYYQPGAYPESVRKHMGVWHGAR